jgi:release factor glutamine methyltransferase
VPRVLLMRDNSNNRYQLHSTTKPYLDMVRKHVEPYTFTLNGEEILVLPGVMSPKYDWAGHYMIENLPDVRDADVLEVGSGCGLVAMAAYRRGARRVLATDINPVAVENTRLNFERIGAQHACEAILSDMFEDVSGQFDVVIFNAPYHGCAAGDDLEKGVADENYRALTAFFRDIHQHIKSQGRVVVGFSSSGDHDLFDGLVKESSLRLVTSVEDTRWGYQCEVHTFDTS